MRMEKKNMRQAGSITRRKIKFNILIFLLARNKSRPTQIVSFRVVCWLRCGIALVRAPSAFVSVQGFYLRQFNLSDCLKSTDPYVNEVCNCFHRFRRVPKNGIAWQKNITKLISSQDLTQHYQTTGLKYLQSNRRHHHHHLTNVHLHDNVVDFHLRKLNPMQEPTEKALRWNGQREVEAVRLVGLWAWQAWKICIAKRLGVVADLLVVLHSLQPTIDFIHFHTSGSI